MNIGLKSGKPDLPTSHSQDDENAVVVNLRAEPVSSLTSPRPPVRPARRTDPDMHFRVDLDIFRGPLDLLLYLVRKHELEATNIRIAMITQQFLEHLEVLEQLDVNAVGDFLEMASVLIEIKSKLVLPRCDDEEDVLEDPSEELVQQLLTYKKYKDAASMLEERGRAWSQCYTRIANDLPPREVDLGEQPIQEVELWDLVSALGRVMRANELVQPTSIVYDDTPIQVYMQTIHDRIRSDGQVAFSDMFQPGMHKSSMIGVFLGVLELVRHHHVIAEQEEGRGEIYLMPGPSFSDKLELADVDNYDGAVATEEDDAPVKPR